jgi:hypothetical protein
VALRWAREFVGHRTLLLTHAVSDSGLRCIPIVGEEDMIRESVQASETGHAVGEHAADYVLSAKIE